MNIIYQGKDAVISPFNFISHSAKGSIWKNHKYIKKMGSRYIYKESLSKLTSGSKEKFDKTVKDKIKSKDYDGLMEMRKDSYKKYQDAMKDKDVYMRQFDEDTIFFENFDEKEKKKIEELDEKIKEYGDQYEELSEILNRH